MRRSERKEMNACTDLNFSQWEHIMHHQFIPIGEVHVGIYMQYIHHLRVCANTYTCNRSSMGMHHASPVDPHRRGGHL